MKRIDVVKTDKGWAGKDRQGNKVAAAPTKTETVQKVAKVAKADRSPVTVKIHKQDGRIQEERTYPRSADPKSSKG